MRDCTLSRQFFFLDYNRRCTQVSRAQLVQKQVLYMTLKLFTFACVTSLLCCFSGRISHFVMDTLTQSSLCSFIKAKCSVVVSYYGP